MRTIFALAVAAALVVLVPSAAGREVAQASSGHFVQSQGSGGCVSRIEARAPRTGVDLAMEESDPKAHRLVIPMALLVALVECPAWPGDLRAPREAPDPTRPASGAPQSTLGPTSPEPSRPPRAPVRSRHARLHHQPTGPAFALT